MSPPKADGTIHSDISSTEGAAERMKNTYALNVKNLERLNSERKMSVPVNVGERAQASEPMMNFLYRHRYVEDPNQPLAARAGSRSASRGFRSVGRDGSRGRGTELSGYISPDLVSLDYDRGSVNPIFSPKINRVSK